MPCFPLQASGNSSLGILVINVHTVILFFFEIPLQTGSYTSPPGRPSCSGLGHSPQPMGKQVSISVQISICFEVLQLYVQARGDIVGEAIEGKRPADQTDERDPCRHQGSLRLNVEKRFTIVFFKSRF